MSREPVLSGDAEQIAAFLREHAGEWYLISPVPCPKSRAGVIKQTAHRIRRGKLAAFPLSDAGRWEVSMTAADDRPDAVAEVEMTARWVPSDGADALVGADGGRGDG